MCDDFYKFSKECFCFAREGFVDFFSLLLVCPVTLRHPELTKFALRHNDNVKYDLEA